MNYTIKKLENGDFEVVRPKEEENVAKECLPDAF
jgi:hypothetical protein